MNYQERVSTATDVRALFDRVKQNPAIEKYRGYTDSKSYGWDPIADCYIKREGEVFFDNPAYAPDYLPVGVDGAPAVMAEGEAEKSPAAEVGTEEGPVGEERPAAEPSAEPKADKKEEALPVSEATKAYITGLENEICRLLAERNEARSALQALREAIALVSRLAAAE